MSGLEDLGKVGACQAIATRAQGLQPTEGEIGPLRKFQPHGRGLYTGFHPTPMRLAGWRALRSVESVLLCCP